MLQTKTIYDTARELPLVWETRLFGNSELYKRAFMAHIQSGSESKQTYYLTENADGIDGGIVSSLRLRATKWLPSMNTVICRYPLSLPTRGYALSQTAVESAVRVLSERKEALKMVLCDAAVPNILPKGWRVKSGMPYAVFVNEYRTFEEYLKSLKKNYRKSVKRSLRKFDGIAIREEKGNDFTARHYELYQGVARKARYKGFLMRESFFTGINIDHLYLSAYFNGQIVGWVMLLFDGPGLYAPICGFDLEKNRRHDIWRNLHIAAIKKAIDGGYSTLDFGDTAEIGKTSLGCVLKPRYLLVKHENELLNNLLLFSGWFEYKLTGMMPQPFKRTEG
jgi:uncharacterized protein YnzC (UPF0291/DUF896 family)